MSPKLLRVAPALLAALAIAQSGGLGCAAKSDASDRPTTRLERDFPNHASEVLQSGSGWRSAADRFTATGALALDIPASSQPIELHLGGHAVRVTELGRTGTARAVEHAVVFDRRDGESYWVSNARGAEEWLRLDEVRGATLRWRVEGAALKGVGGAVYLLENGAPVAVVRAPAAYLASGRKVATQLAVAGDAIELSVEGSGPALVDPTWTAVAQMVDARSEHTATLLADGRVLVVGGMDSFGNAMASAEIFDPATNLWTDAAPLASDPSDSGRAARWGHTATLLTDGRVLVAGGTNGSTALVSAEVYDPVSNGWTPVHAMAQKRHHHTATLLLDGRVLVAGGDDTNSTGFNALPKAEVYDPAANTWTDHSASFPKRSHAAAVLLGDGRVLVVGGNNHNTTTTIEAGSAIFNPANNTWVAATGGLVDARYDFTLSVLPDGTILAAGGIGKTGTTPIILASAEKTTISGNTLAWSAAGTLNPARYGHEALVLPDGKVLACGGYVAPNGWLDNGCELYDPVSNAWTTTDSMTTVRAYDTATLLASGRVLFAGGQTWDGQNVVATPNAEVFDDFDTHAGWADAGPMPGRGAASTTIAGGRVLIAGGMVGSSASSNAYLLGPGGLSPIAPLLVPRAFATATLLPDRRVLVAGGFTADGGVALKSAEAYCPDDGGWEPVPSMTQERGYHTATALPDGRVLVAGGNQSGDYSDDLSALATTEIFDWTTDTWSPGPSLNQARHGQTATLMPDGSVLVAGGIYTSGTTNDGGGSNSSEQLAPGSVAWLGATMVHSRIFHTATLMPDGSLLVVGGVNSASCKDNTEIFQNGVWSAGPTNMPEAHCGHAATLLEDGELLVAGGATSEPFGSNLTAGAALYDPYTGDWTSAAAMPGTAIFPAAALLDDGTAAVAGSGSIWLYDEGRGASRRPTLDSITPNHIGPGGQVAIAGTRFTGFSTGALGEPREGASGDPRSSPSNLPLLQVERIGNGERFFASVSSWDGGSALARIPASVQPGWQRTWVTVNGVSSTRQATFAQFPQGNACNHDFQCATGFCVDGFCCDTACGGGAANDCMACSVSLGASANGICTAAPSGTLCTGGSCDNAGVCQPPSSGSTGSASSGSTTSTSGSTSSGSGSTTSTSGSTSSGSGSTTSTSGSTSSGSGTTSSSSGSASSGSGSTSSSSGSTIGGSAGAGGTTGGPDKFSLSGCGCTTLADPGFGVVALLLLGLRRRREA